MTQRKPTGGAPAGNTNAMKHSLRATESIRRGLQIGQAAPGGHTVSRVANEFRRQVEKAFLAKYKVQELTFGAAASVQAATRCEMIMTLIQTQIRKQGKALTPETLTTLMTLEIRALGERTRHLESLGLGAAFQAKVETERDALSGVLFGGNAGADGDGDGEPDGHADSTSSPDTTATSPHADADGELGAVGDGSVGDGADAGDAN